MNQMMHPGNGHQNLELENCEHLHNSKSKYELYDFCSFRKIFSENSSGGSFPRRSLSTLTKMALSATDEPIPV